MDGIYVMKNCHPDGTNTIAAVQPGEILEREISFRVNAPIELQKQLESRILNGELDPRDILHGVDGELYDEDGNFLATVPSWELTMDVQTQDYQAAGKMIIWGVTTGYSLHLTLTETIVNDNLLVKIVNGLQTGRSMPKINFMGVLRSHAA